MQASERSEWTKPTDMATTMWVTLRADGIKPPFGNGKDVATFTAMAFDLDKRTAELAANFAGIDILAIAYKEAGGGGAGMECRSMRGAKRFS